jgi:hypothetical protein
MGILHEDININIFSEVPSFKNDLNPTVILSLLLLFINKETNTNIKSKYEEF